MEKIYPAFRENNVAVCFFSDDNYVPYLGTAVYSAIKNVSADTNLDILIFENGYSEKNKQLLLNLASGKRNVSIRLIDLLPLVEELKVNPSKHVSINCFAKIFCTDDMFCDYERIIAMDSDLLVLKDLADLAICDMEGKPIAAVKDLYFPIMLEKGYHTDERLGYITLQEYVEALGLDGNNYFNTGVVLFDVNKCREISLQEKVIKINNKYPAMMYAAQDDLNMVLKDNWKELNIKWNYQNPYSLLSHLKMFPSNYNELYKDAAVLHFLGRSKPWADNRVMYADVFDTYASETPWADIYFERKKNSIKKNRWASLLIPKGSKRRELYLKWSYKRKTGK